MIKDRMDLRAYREADRLALRRTKSLAAWVSDEIWRYQRALRRLEYERNCDHRLRGALMFLRVTRLGNRLGYSIAPNVFGPGLSIAHPGTISVNRFASVGTNCRISIDVVIGSDLYVSEDAPTIGSNTFIGPGAKILGKLQLGDNVIVGANAVVTKSFPEGNVVLAGIPAVPVKTLASPDEVWPGFHWKDPRSAGS